MIGNPFRARHPGRFRGLDFGDETSHERLDLSPPLRHREAPS
jgi:hypothetical protein